MRSSLRNNKLIAIAGLKGSGKDSAAHMLEYLLNAPAPFRSYFWYKIFKKWPGKWQTTAFAKPLKQTLSILLNKPLEWFEDRYNKENMFVHLDTLLVVDRSVIQESDNILSENKFSKLIKTGEPFPEETYLSVRQLMQYYGTEVMRKYIGDSTWINATLNACTNRPTIISDLRFMVEYDEVKARGGEVWYIARADCIPGSHRSEWEVIEMENHNMFDHVFVNDYSLQDLYETIKYVCYGRKRNNNKTSRYR